MLWVDIGLALAVAVLLSVLLLRFVHEHGPWRRPWRFSLAVFLFAWAGGVWLSPGRASGWIVYWLPFLLVGLLAALLIVSVSPRHELRSREDTEQFEREEQAVVASISVFLWILWATVLGAIVVGYLR